MIRWLIFLHRYLSALDAGLFLLLGLVVLPVKNYLQPSLLATIVALRTKQMENKVETKYLAEFYKVTRQSVEKWTPEKRKQKTVQALANAKQSICDLIADISKLVFIFNCKWLHGEKQVKSAVIYFDHGSFMVEGTEFWQSVNLHATDVVDQLQSIKTKLEELVYGVSTIDKRS